MEFLAIMDVIDRYLSESEAAIRAISRDDVRKVVDLLELVWATDRTTFIIGNGGSASTASHMMNDLNKLTSIEGKRRFRSIALTDNVPLITAIGNDLDYGETFVEPLKNLLRPGDVLIAISGSGNSANVVNAARYAHAIGAPVIGLCGDPDGQLPALADLKIVVPAGRISQQEDGHLVLTHALAIALRERIAQADDADGVAVSDALLSTLAATPAGCC